MTRSCSLAAALVLAVGPLAALVAPAPADAAPADAAPPVVSASSPDPAVPGPYSSVRDVYDAGVTEVGGGPTREEIEQELNGDIFIPQGTTGPMPVILLEHGRHATCTINGVVFQVNELGDPCPSTAVTEPINSYAGYDYLATQPASHGYLVMSVDANGVNTYDDASLSPVGDEGAYARAQIVSKSLDLLAAWDAAPTSSGVGNALVGRVDLSRIGVMGHSRGGEGINAFVAYNKTRPADQAAAAQANTLDFGPRYPGLEAAFALAPIDAAAQAPTGVAMGTLVPYCDGDVSDLSGTRPFEWEATANSAAGFPSVLYGVQGTDHNFYNTVWASGDDDAGDADSACGTGAGSIRLTPTEEQATASVLIAGFLRRFVGPEPDLEPLVTGAAHLPASACPAAHAVSCDQEVQTSYITPAPQRRVLAGPRTSGDVPTTATGFTTDSTCTPANNGTGCPAAPTGTDTAFIDRSTTPQRHLARKSSGLSAIVTSARVRRPSAAGVSISCAKAATGDSPMTTGCPATRVRRTHRPSKPRPRPGSPLVLAEPCAGSAHITPPGRSRLPVRALSTSTSQLAVVPKLVVVVPMRA